jgi:hypothetical protein
MSIEAMKQALEALEEATSYTGSPSWSPSMTLECIAAAEALHEAIETAEKQEPLTDEQINDIARYNCHLEFDDSTADDIVDFARAIEAAHGITGETK